MWWLLLGSLAYKDWYLIWGLYHKPGFCFIQKISGLLPGYTAMITYIIITIIIARVWHHPLLQKIVSDLSDLCAWIVTGLLLIISYYINWTLTKPIFELCYLLIVSSYSLSVKHDLGSSWKENKTKLSYANLRMNLMAYLSFPCHNNWNVDKFVYSQN